MSSLIDKLTWFFVNADAHQVAAPLILPFAIAFGLYQSHYPWALVRALYQRAFGDGFVPFVEGGAPALAMTIPTLLRSADDLEGLRTSLRSVTAARYPGPLSVVVVIDGSGTAPALFDQLRAFVAGLSLPVGMRVDVLGSPQRVGKAMAGDLGVQHILALEREGLLPARPAIYFNMDADCELGAYALERMVRALQRPSRLTGKPGMIVTSHVAIRQEHYLPSLRSLFTVRGWIAVTVAREYLVAIGLGRTNAMRVMPQNGASGALYCTWMEIVEAAPHWGRFLQELRFVDWVRWWLGGAPPVFDPQRIAPLPEAMTGMGEDTWMSWLACAARWEGGRPTVALPRTPAHAAWYALVAFLARPFRYDPLAKVYTTTPTTLRALFNQRVRWNVSRIWTVQCWGVALLYHLSIGIWALLDVVVATLFQALAVVALILSPFAGPTPAMAPALFVLVELAYVVERTVGTCIAMIVDRDERGQWKKLLGLPFAGFFHIAFNIATTISGFVRQVFGHGYNDRFAPEETLIRGGTSRIALGYRLRRFYGLAVRSVLHGDVPLGWFWLGWGETAWTPNGYEGWTTGTTPRPVRAPVPTPALVEQPVDLPLAVTESPALDPRPTLAADEGPDSGVRARPELRDAGTSAA